MSRALVLAAMLPGILLACGGFTSGSDGGASDAGAPSDAAVVIPEGGGDVVSDGGTPGDASAPPDAATIGDSGSSPHCLSQHAEPDGGCDPLIFVSAEKRTGNMLGSGHVVGDAVCTFDADGTGATVHAWLSTPDESAMKYFATLPAGRPLWLPDGATMVAASYAALLTMGPLHPISLDFNRNAVAAGDTVWTGASPAGETESTCGTWNSTTGGGNYGDPLDVTTPGAWANAASDSCSVLRRFYCIELVP